MQILATDQPPLPPLSRAKALMRCLRCGLDPFAVMLDYGAIELREADPDVVTMPPDVMRALRPSEVFRLRMGR